MKMTKSSFKKTNSIFGNEHFFITYLTKRIRKSLFGLTLKIGDQKRCGDSTQKAPKVLPFLSFGFFTHVDFGHFLIPVKFFMVSV